MSSVIWITGLSGSGKSTLAQAVHNELMNVRPSSSVFLDGDELRKLFAKCGENSEYSEVQRVEYAKKYSLLCKMLAEQGIIVVIATISLYSQIHEWNRKNLPNYFEILIEANIETLKKRDPKGIYKRFMCGELTNVSGLDLEVEMPCSPDHVLLAETNYNCESEASKIVSRVLRLKQNEN